MPGIVYTTFYANTRVDMPFCCPTAAFITAERSQSFHRSAAIECLASMDLLQDSSTVNNNTVNCVNNTNLWCYEGVAWIRQCCCESSDGLAASPLSRHSVTKSAKVEGKNMFELEESLKQQTNATLEICSMKIRSSEAWYLNISAFYS